MFIAKVNRFDRKLGATFKNSMVLSNSGNYGLPVSELVFAANPAGMSIQIITSIFQNILTFTYGFFNSVSAQSSGIRNPAKNYASPSYLCVTIGHIVQMVSCGNSKILI